MDLARQGFDLAAIDRGRGRPGDSRRLLGGEQGDQRLLLDDGVRKLAVGLSAVLIGEDRSRQALGLEVGDERRQVGFGGQKDELVMGTRLR
jgi:hypothetical protein